MSKHVLTVTSVRYPEYNFLRQVRITVSNADLFPAEGGGCSEPVGRRSSSIGITNVRAPEYDALRQVRFSVDTHGMDIIAGTRSEIGTAGGDSDHVDDDQV